MNNYEKTIGFKTIWTSIIRRWHIFLMIFVPVCLVSLLVTNVFFVKTYISAIAISRGGIINATHYAIIQNYVTNTSSKDGNEGAVYITALNLKEEGFTHKNGSEITVNEIYSGISFRALETNALEVSFSFQSTDSSITQKVLNELTKNAINNLKVSGAADYNQMSIVGDGASSPVKNSKERTYFLIALAAGFVVAFGIPFVDEIVSDEVYDKYDIEALGCSAFEVKAKPKKKEA